MRYYWALVKHFLTANSRHGTHSPFVYRLTEDVIYAKKPLAVTDIDFPKAFNTRYKRLLALIMSFLGIEKLGTFADGQDQYAVWVDLHEVPAAKISHLIQQGRVIIVHEPYKAKEAWHDIVADAHVIVSIDLFHFGILMHRGGQRKEHFMLRYPYWRGR